MKSVGGYVFKFVNLLPLALLFRHEIMASSAESGIDVDSKKGSMSGSKTDKKEKSSDDLFGSKISVSHIIISGLGADETSVVQGHLGFLNPGNDDTDNRNRYDGSLILVWYVIDLILICRTSIQNVIC